MIFHHYQFGHRKSHSYCLFESDRLNEETRIEGSTLIIATCIPTLQPLLKIFRRHIRLQEHSSNSQRGWYGSSRPNHRPDLATEPGPKPRVTRPRNELDSILNTQNKDMESQTNILGGWAVDCESEGQRTREGILKTEEVSITYADKAKEIQQSKDHPANWRPSDGQMSKWV